MKKFFLIFTFLCLPVFAREYPAPTFESPRATMNYFLKTMKGHKTGDSRALDLAVKALNLAELESAVKDTSGRVYATLLIKTLDRMEYINVNKIPQKLDADRWVYKKEIIESAGDFKEVEISIGKNKDGQWLFTPKTLKDIRSYYESLKEKQLAAGVTELNDWREKFKRRMPSWTGRRSFILMNGQWLGILLIIFVALIIEKLMRGYVGWLTEHLLGRKDVQITDEHKKKFTFPIGIMTFAGFWTLAIRLLELEVEVLSVLLRGGHVLFTLGCVLTAHHVVDVLCLFLDKKARESENKFDDILVPLVRKASKFFVVAIGIVFIGDSLTLDMKSILAGLGIGGLAFALAAKDTISNLFGSLTVLLDRPFRIGDWVLINGNIEGTIEEVGIRSCRIRTFADSLITLPNGNLTNAAIENFGQRTYRRLSTKINIQYDTPPAKIEKFCQGIRDIIEAHPHTRKDYYHVYFNSMSDSSLDIMLYVFWRVPDWKTELQEKHKLYMDIVKLAEEMGVQFAFPTRTLHMFTENE